MSPVTRNGLIIALATFAADQLSKWLLLSVADIGARSPVTVAPFLDLVMVWNYGISFGMFAHASAARSLTLILLSLAISAWLLVWLARTRSRLIACGIGLVVGGALGNVLDRIRFGAVADFFYFHAGEYGWPAFNLADSAICIGVALLCIESMLSRDKKDQAP